MATTIFSRGKIRTYVVALVLLLVVLVGLLFLLYLFSQPPVNVGAKKAKGYSHVFSIYGFEGDRLHRPVEATVDKDGNIYVVDSFKHRIVVFDPEGVFVRQFGAAGEGRDQLQFPSAVAVGPDGRAYVLCASQNKIVVYRNYKPYWVIDVEKPLAATVKKNRLYVTTARGIMIGDLDGKLIDSFGVRGNGKGAVDLPNGIAVDDKDNIYISDSMNYRIQAFNKEGKPLWTLGKPPKSKKEAIKSTERSYGLPTGMAIDENGTLYFMDAFNGEIVLADSKTGKEIKRVGDWGHDDGQFYYPGGIAYAGNRTFLVADKFNDRVQALFIQSPVASPMTQATQYSAPVASLLLAGLVLAWLLRRRKRVVAADAAFLEWAVESDSVAMLKNEFRVIRVPEEVYEAFKDRVQGGKVSFADILEIGKYNEKKADAIAKELGIDAVSARTLAICMKRRSKSTLLADDQQLRSTAEKLGIAGISHGELAELFEDTEAQSEPA